MMVSLANSCEKRSSLSIRVISSSLWNKGSNSILLMMIFVSNRCLIMLIVLQNLRLTKASRWTRFEGTFFMMLSWYGPCLDFLECAHNGFTIIVPSALSPFMSTLTLCRVMIKLTKLLTAYIPVPSSAEMLDSWRFRKKPCFVLL